MALSLLTSSDYGVGARNKINNAIEQAGLVSDLLSSVSTLSSQVAARATAAALAAEAATRAGVDTSLGSRIDAETSRAMAAEDTKATAAALNAEAARAAAAESALSSTLSALQIQLTPYVDLVGGAPDRPGDARTLFTRVMTGSPKGRPAIDKGTVEDGGVLGQVLRISGPDVDPTAGYIDVAPRRAYYMRPGRTYLVQHQFARFTDPSDPSQHAVELRFQNLSSTFGQVSNVRLGAAYTPSVSTGPLFIDTFIGKAGAPGTISYTIPETSAYGVPYFRVYGNGAQTDLGLVRLYDVSDALAGGADVASLLARVAAFEARLKALEGATGIDATYIDGIAQDRLAVRTTRYWGRPGEATRTWTASIAATSAAAVPLVVGGAYSVVATTMGPALRITGAASARPIYQVPLDDTQVEEFKAVIKRGVDDTTTPANPANNAPVFVFACFKADGTDNGTVALPADALTVAQGFKSYIFRASLVAGLGTVDLPANTRRVNLLPGGKGTGAVDVISVERTSQSLTTAPEMTDAIAPEDRFFIFDDSVKLIKKLAPLTLAQYVEAYLAPPPVYWFKGPKVASKAEQTLVASPGGAAIIQNVRIQNTSTKAYIAVAFRGITASLTDGGSYVFGPGQGRDFDVIPQGRIGYISDTEGSSIACDFTSTVNLDPNSSDRAAKHLARYGTAMTAPQSAAVGALYNALYDAGWIDLCAKGGYLWVGSAPSNFDGLINWSGTNSFSRILLGDNTIQPDTSFSGTLFNGSNAIDSLVRPLLADLPHHALFAWTDNTLKNAAKVSAGNTVIRLNPDRSSGADSMFTGAGSSILTGIPGYGGLKGYVRRDADNFRYYRNGDYRQDAAKTVNETTGGSQTIAIGALNTGSGIQQGETTPMKMSLYTPTIPTDDQVTKLYNAFAAFHTALGA